MKVNFNKNLTEIDGSPLYERNQLGQILLDNKKEKRIRSVKKTVVALLANVTEEDDDKTKKVEKFILAQKIQQANKLLELKAEEIVLVKDSVAKYEPPVVVGQIFNLFEKLD